MLLTVSYLFNSMRTSWDRTVLGECRKKYQFPVARSCPSNADSASTSQLWNTWSMALGWRSEQREFQGNLKQGFDFKNVMWLDVRWVVQRTQPAAQWPRKPPPHATPRAKPGRTSIDRPLTCSSPPACWPCTLLFTLIHRPDLVRASYSAHRTSASFLHPFIALILRALLPVSLHIATRPLARASDRSLISFNLATLR